MSKVSLVFNMMLTVLDLPDSTVPLSGLIFQCFILPIFAVKVVVEIELPFVDEDFLHFDRHTPIRW